MKKRIPLFYVLLILLVVALAVVQILRFNGLTGFVVKNDLSNLQKASHEGFEGKILDYVREGNSLTVNYVLNDLDGLDQEAIVNYRLIDSEGYLVKEGEQRIIIGGGLTRYVLKFDLPKNSFGSFNITLDVQSAKENLVLSREVFMSGESMTGLAISENNKESLSILGIVVLSLLILFMLFKIAKNLIKPKRNVLEEKRHLISLDLK